MTCPPEHHAHQRRAIVDTLEQSRALLYTATKGLREIGDLENASMVNVLAMELSGRIGRLR